MQVAVFIDCNSFLISEENYCFRLILQIDADTSILCLYIDE